MRTPALCLAVLGALAACAPFPELDAIAPETGPPPRLLPIDGLVRQAEVTTDDPGPALSARAARLRARAAAIKATPTAS